MLQVHSFNQLESIRRRILNIEKSEILNIRIKTKKINITENHATEST